MSYEYGYQRYEAAREALRIIEAAGDGETEDVDFAEARHRLRCSVKHHAERAEREAEDVKVQEFFTAMYEAANIPMDHTFTVTDQDRRRYRAARKFFAGQLTSDDAKERAAKAERDEARVDESAPRVLQYGDPEPGRDTKWNSPCGVFHHTGEGWTSHAYFNSYPWDWFKPGNFPMTEVTG